MVLLLYLGSWLFALVSLLNLYVIDGLTDCIALQAAAQPPACKFLAT